MTLIASRFRSLGFAMLGAFLALGSPAEAQSPSSICLTDEASTAPGRDSSVGNGIAFQDTLRALVVFVRFPDDDAEVNPNWPRAWPTLDLQGNLIPYTELPNFAESYFESDASAVSSLSVNDPSLSAYFYHQSKNGPAGPHVLYGDVWPRNGQGEPEVFVPSMNNIDYHTRLLGDSTKTPPRKTGYGYLTKEILDSLVVSPGFDIGDYDRNGDGQVDHMFMIVRSDFRISGSGWAALDGRNDTNFTKGVPVPSLAYWSPSRRECVKVSWAYSGSQNVVGNWTPNYSLVVHEYGHRLFDMGHTNMITTNDVPLVALAGGSPTNRKYRVYGCAYNRMCGTQPSGTYDTSASTLSAFEMRRMGWAARTVLDPAAGDQSGLTVSPLFASGQVVLIPLKAGSAGDTLSFESRQWTNFFDERRLHYIDVYTGNLFSGIATTGLLATLSKGNPRGSYTYDFVPPDNHYDSISLCDGTSPGCSGANGFVGDMLHPQATTQLTPWTRPNVSGYTLYPAGFEPNWFAVDDVRYTGAADSTMAFDFYADFRTAPEVVIRADSWMGQETATSSGGTAYVFTRPVRLTDGARLRVWDNATITFAAGLTVEDGAELICETGSTCTIEDPNSGAPPTTEFGSSAPVVQPEATLAAGEGRHGLDGSGLPPGVYRVRATVASGTEAASFTRRSTVIR